MAKQKSRKSAVARKTRIDKDVKTTLRQSRMLSFLYDLMWSYRHFKYLALALLLADAVLGYLIIQYIPYTEIDWKAYMQQVEMFKAGERDYIKIRGDTGPLVYPAGFLYVFSVLHTVTDAGTNIRRAQYIFLGFYLITIATVLAIYNRARVMPPWAVVFICLSKRLHSIYMLRLFNDGVAMMLLFIAVYLFASQKWRMGCAFFSFAVSIKMNVLLFAPALFFLLLQSCGVLRTLWYLVICASIQIILALPFLRHNWFNYLLKAFELSRVFTYKWTVNWKFLGEELFVSKQLALGLLGAHIVFLIFFLQKHFNIIGTFRAVLYKPFAIYEPFPIRSEVVVTSMFAINFVGIAFARTMHYQFYSWYYPTLPYLLWKTNMPLLFKIKSLIITEYAFNTFPATGPSSLALQLVNFFLLISLYFTDDVTDKYVAYLDADARVNLLAFINEECFDGARQFALYYGSVTEDLAEGALVSSIDEREVVLTLPKLKLTLAVGFGSSAPVTSEGYGKQVLKQMLAEAVEGIRAGETMGSLINKEYTKEQEELAAADSASGSLRRRGGGGDAPAV
uniref:dolichyl-P-Man:Man5GlcNAc2-PP-dolichol alpha-1,3-mannosyltransferase n=1 Tax=Globisporangium ultimum (strain ATCC 200006 / CBS 805.95 / DAOM BR144) TaxID=431595 RepID=K3WI15_GLOUD